MVKGFSRGYRISVSAIRHCINSNNEYMPVKHGMESPKNIQISEITNVAVNDDF